MKVLLADDQRLARTIVTQWLRGWGYDVVAVTDGAAALAALAADTALSLAVIDWEMPGVDGLEVCRSVRALAAEPYTYLILLTAHSDKDDVVKGLEAGADDYIVKPCNPLELEVRLRAGRRIVELSRELTSARESLRFEATHDALTGLLNRRAVLARLDEELSRAGRNGAPVTLALLDLDHFKRINDTYGHCVGDEVLKGVAARMRSAVRVYDAVGRFGGEEFVIVLPEAEVSGGLALSARLGSVLGGDPVDTSVGPMQVTASVGIASTRYMRGASAATLVRAADVALYRAKAAGRNRAELAKAPDYVSEPAPSPARAEASSA